MPWENLLNPSGYGAEEYGILVLITFIAFVAVKHLIFHTVYYWWYGGARFYLPANFWNMVTGKSLPQRLLHFIKQQNTDVKSASAILAQIEYYSSEKEFALTLGKKKGEVLDKIVAERKPDRILVCGAVCGYSVIRILKSTHKSARLVLLESDSSNCSVVKSLCEMAGYGDQVTVLSSEWTSSILELKEHYGFDKLDFVFLTSKTLGEPYYDKVVSLLLSSDLFHGKDSGEGQRTVVLADKVVHFRESEFLKQVRYSDDFETEYYQMPLEYSPSGIVDGMEKATYIG